MNLIEVQNVTKRFSGHTALDGVTLSVPEKSIYGLLGPNGAGKTTLIRIINQITAPDEGKIFFQGKALQAEDIFRIGYLPEERGLYKKMKVGEQALYLAQLKGMGKQQALKSLKEWFEKFEIDGWWNKKVEELSKGMQQKVQFIVTVIHKPPLLIFDEPFSGFDPINVNLLKKEILRLKKEGSTIIFSTHNMSSVEELCDNIALLNKSKKILDGDVHQIKQTYRSNTFQIEFKGSEIQQHLLPVGFDLIGQKSINGFQEAIIRLPQNLKPNDLLQVLIGQAEIYGFHEILPTMNDIFIETVNKAN